jgi:hypothetical protein
MTLHQLNPNRYTKIELEVELKKLIEERTYRDLTDDEIEFIQDAELIIKFKRNGDSN